MSVCPVWLVACLFLNLLYVFFTFELHSHNLVFCLPSLQDQIMEVGGSRMKQQQAQVDKVSREIDGSNEAITKANVAIKTAER